MKTLCLRCGTELREYKFTRMTFMPYGYGHAHVMLECSTCGHVEFLSGQSPLLKDLSAVRTYAGDGD
jgi:RNase P subunit RPR2